MGKKLGEPSDGYPLARQAAARSSVFETLAWLFSYPSREQARESTSEGFLARMARTLEDAALGDTVARPLFVVCEKEALQAEEQRVDRLRIEYTRLFVTPPRLVRMEGSHWVKRRTPLSRSKGEGFAVAQAYRELGLARKPEAKDPADHIVSELDYVSYVAAAEARAWEGGDAASAHEWRQLAESFLACHVSELATGVSSEVLRLSNNPFMRLYAGLLHDAVASASR